MDATTGAGRIGAHRVEFSDSHATFEAYCRERWGWSRQHAYEVMDAAAVAGALSATADTVPKNERQARAMLNSLEPAERQQVRQGIAPEHVVRKMAAPPPASPPSRGSD